MDREKPNQVSLIQYCYINIIIKDHYFRLLAASKNAVVGKCLMGRDVSAGYP